jgi:putative ABC transport system permease protein
VNYIAWRMLVGDRTKYVSLVVGLTFATFLMTEQGSIFVGMMRRAYSTVSDIPAARVWVMDPEVQYPEDLKPLKDVDLYRVRDVPGVDWAVPFFKGGARARTANGAFQSVNVIGVDQTSLIGAPARMIQGKVTDLWQTDAAILDDAGARRMGGVKVGDVLELNDHRARIVGICRVGRTFSSMPVIYSTYTRATDYAPSERHMLSFVLVAPKPGVSDDELVQRIRTRTGLGAFTSWGFCVRTLVYYTKKTGATINLGMTVILGFLIGLAIAAQTFYSFTIENLKHFGALKAMGATNGMLVRMVLLQGTATGMMAYGLGTGGAELLGTIATRNTVLLAFHTPPFLLAGVFVFEILLVGLASIMCITTVVRLEPAIVFRG